MGSFSIMHWLVLLVFFGLYFAPSIVAVARNSPQKLPIVLLNVFLGWTFVGWVGALVWSFVNFSKAEIR